jgi:hypothetical protein
MSDEDELANALDEIESSDDSSDAEITESEVSESYEIPAEEDSMSDDDDSSSEGGVTQAEVYENLKRIGELEDEKQKIQDELRERTEQLRAVVRHIDRGSILYKMLQSVLADSAAKAAPASAGKKTASKAAPKAAAKKTSKKKARRK